MRSYFKGLMADAGLKAAYTRAERVRGLAFGFYLLAGVVADLTRGY